MRFLEEFWYGNIEPTEYDTASNKEYKKLVELIFQNGFKLGARMMWKSLRNNRIAYHHSSSVNDDRRAIFAI